jgi:hypothetical protein
VRIGSGLSKRIIQADGQLSRGRFPVDQHGRALAICPQLSLRRRGDAARAAKSGQRICSMLAMRSLFQAFGVDRMPWQYQR